MKTTLIGILLVTLAIGTQAQECTKRYLLKSGKIEYTIQGTINGTETLYWDDFGAQELKVTAYTDSKGKKIVNYSLLTDNKNYNWTEGNKAGKKSENPYIEFYRAYATDNWKMLGDNCLQEMGFTKTGNAKVFKHNCETWEGPAKIWVWNMLPLKVQVNQDKLSYTQTVTNITENFKNLNNTFSLPKNVVFEDYYDVSEFEIIDF